jgi:hypothetical protein
MKADERDVMYGLFSEMQDERLPMHFQAKVMQRIQKEAARRRRSAKRWEIVGYVAGIVAMLTVCAVLWYVLDLSFEFPEFGLFADGFPRPDFSLFRSPSFLFSAYIGALAFVLLIVDSAIRRRLEKNKHE